MNPHESYGLLAEFEQASDLMTATRRAYSVGYRDLEAYSPFPIEGLAEAMEFRRTKIPLIMLIGGIVGCVSGYALAYYCSAIAYPVNVGGRPLNSWPAFIPVMFELTILISALSGVFGMLALNGLPRPHHPLFAVPQFDRATRDRFFLCIRASDPLFAADATRAFLAESSAMEVIDVAR